MAGELTSISLAMGMGVVDASAPILSPPSAFTVGQWSVSDAATGGTATVTISALPSNGGSAITAIQYKAGAGAWTNSGITGTGTFNITGLTNGTAVNVLVRAVNAIGNGPDSDAKSVTPTAAPSEIAWTPMMIGAKSGQTARDPSSYKTVSATQAAPGDAVETWSDISGNGRDLVSAAATAGASTTATRAPLAPIETLGGFTGSPLRMNSGVLTHRYIGPASGFAMPSGSLGDILFLFARHRPPATALTRIAVGNASGNFNINIALSSTTAAGQVYTGSTAGSPKTDPTTRLEMLVQEKAVAAGNNYKLRVNGAEVLSPDGAGSSVGTTGRIVLGNYYGTTNAGADMDVFEFWILPQGTTRANVQRLEGWCAHTYGQQALLPSDHPYKSVPPKVPAGTTTTTDWIDANFVTSTANQTWLGPQVELQADSYDGSVSVPPPTDGTSQIWGIPYSLTTSERARFKAEWFPGGGVRYQFLRFPLGFAYRGLRNIDGTTGLAKNIGERFSGQNAAIADMLTNVNAGGGGLIAEYWSPAPHWKCNSSFSGGAGTGGGGTLWAGGSNARSVTLDSIKGTDLTQYNAQIAAFTDAIVNDLEYLHQNIAPVRGFGLQNEASNPTDDAYGHCTYTDQLYVDVLTVLVPKIRASSILSTYGGSANTVVIHANSFNSISNTLNAAPIYSEVAYTTQHRIINLGTSATGVKGDADYVKSNIASWFTSSLNKAVADNEFEYFYDANDDPWTTANTMLVQANFMRLGLAPTHNPMIHIAKPIGQSGQSSNTKGYAVTAVRLPSPFSQDPSTPGDPYPSVGFGQYITQPINANAVKCFADVIKVGAKIQPSQATVSAGQQVVPFVNPDGKRGMILINRNTTVWSAKLGFSKAINAAVKAYSLTDDGTAVATFTAASGASISVPVNSALVVAEQ